MQTDTPPDLPHETGPSVPDHTGAATDTAPEEVDPDIDLDLFPRDHVLEIDVVMDPADWDALRFQSRPIIDMFTGPGCLDGPFESPFTEFPSEVTIDGVVLPDVHLRKKGFIGSADVVRPSLKLDTNDLVPHRDVGGLDKINLSNQLQDPSGFRSCLAAEALAVLGVPGSRCSLAHVTVNGQDLGLYANIEDVTKGVLARAGLDGGQIYEGTLSDFDPGYLLTLEPETPETDPDLALPHALTEALALPDDQLLDALTPLVDLPAVHRAWAAEALLGLIDGFSTHRNNFVVAWPPDAGMVFVPTALEASFGFEASTPAGDHPIATDATFFRRMQGAPATRDAFLLTLDEVLDRWDEPTLHAEIDRLSALAAPFVDAAALAEAVATSDAWVDAREAEVRADAASFADQRPPTLSDFPCFVPGGALTLSFDTTFDTLAAPPGTGASQVTSAEGTFGGGSVVGRDGDTVLLRLLDTSAGQTVIIDVRIDASLADASPSLLQMGTLATTGTYLWLDGRGGAVAGMLGGGDLVLDAWSTTPGAPVRGSFTGSVSLPAP